MFDCCCIFAYLVKFCWEFVAKDAIEFGDYFVWRCIYALRQVSFSFVCDHPRTFSLQLVPGNGLNKAIFRWSVEPCVSPLNSIRTAPL